MDSIQAVSTVTLLIAFLAAYSVQHEVVSLIGERWDIRPARGTHALAGLVFAAGISALIQPALA